MAQALDLSEKGKGPDGEVISLDRRLFMQFQAFGDCANTHTIIEMLEDSGVEGALYADINDPQGIGLITMYEDPDGFISHLRPVLNYPPFAGLTFKPEFTMLGRTYTIGYETNLEDTLFNRPRSRILNPELKWAIWYPLQRAKTFEALPEQEQQIVLREHGGIGFTFGRAGYATDIRLACHGLDKNDNDFVVGIIGRELFPLSAVVQAMRKTKQTSEYLDSLGPFFIGKVIWQSPLHPELRED